MEVKREVHVRKPELLKRIAAVRAAKIAKMAETDSDAGLTEEELDAVLGKLEAACGPTKPPRGEGRKPLLPCAVCRDPEGFIPKGCFRPARVDVTRWGIAGKVCRRCYDHLKDKGRRKSRAKPERKVKTLLDTLVKRRGAA